MDELKIGLLYLSLHNQLVKSIGVGRIINRKEFFCIVGKHYLVPKNLRYVIIKEMEDLNLIKKENKNDIRILKCEIDLENDISKLYQLAGIY